VQIPVAEIPLACTELIWEKFNETDNVTSCFIEEDTNPWKEVFTSIFTYIFLNGGLSLLCLGLAGFAVWKITMMLVRAKSSRKPASRFAIICLCIETLTNLERAVHLAIRPSLDVPSTPIPLTSLQDFVLCSLHPLGSIITSFLIVLAWHRAMNSKQLQTYKSFLSRFRVISFICVGLFVVLEIIGMIMADFLDGSAFSIVLVSVTGVAAGIFYAVIGSRLLIMLRSNSRTPSKKNCQYHDKGYLEH